MGLPRYTGTVATWILIINGTLLLFCFSSIDCGDQVTSVYADNVLVTLFPSETRSKAIEIYNKIPGTLIKFLEEKKIIKKILFKDDISNIELISGTENTKSLDPFQRQLRESIRLRFRDHQVTEIRSEDLAIDIRKRYEAESIGWAERGKKITTTIQFEAPYEVKTPQHWTKINAYVYIHLIQECEDNWIQGNRYKFSYDLSIEINGVSIDSTKAATFIELVTKTDVPNSIKKIESKVQVTWDDL